jgi:hypothetical protein
MAVCSSSFYDDHVTKRAFLMSQIHRAAILTNDILVASGSDPGRYDFILGNMINKIIIEQGKKICVIFGPRK